MNFITPSKMTFCILVLLLTIEGAAATSTDWGRINMQGAVIETACAIDIDSLDQTIDMSVLPLSKIMRDGQGIALPFTINLVKCVLLRMNNRLANWQYFQITFDGLADNGLFGIEGRARGVALQIIDNAGNVVVPGEPLPMVAISEGGRQLNYSLKLVSNKKLLRSGEFTSAIRFKMDYY